MRKTDEQKKAALQQRIAALSEKVQRIEQRENEQARRARAHLGIVIGWGIIEHALAHPHSEVQRVALRLIEAHLRERPDDKPVAKLLERLKAAGESREAAQWPGHANWRGHPPLAPLAHAAAALAGEGAAPAQRAMSLLVPSRPASRSATARSSPGRQNVWESFAR